MKKNKKIDFTIGIFDEITDVIKEKIKKESSNCELYGVGVYTDKIVEEEYKTHPRKNIKERIKLAKEIQGVDFVFLVDEAEPKKIKEIVEKACMEILKNK